MTFTPTVQIVAGPGGCNIWTGKLCPEGYSKSYRKMYERMFGPVPPGLQLDHLCRVRACVNPYHLEPVTPRENTMRSNAITAINARKTHCSQGHEFSPENTRHAYGRRICRACMATYMRAWRKARKAS